MHYAPCSVCKKRFACKKKKVNPNELTSTHDGNLICWECVNKLGMCELCGSIPPDGDKDRQLHYDELCFK